MRKSLSAKVNNKIKENLVKYMRVKKYVLFMFLNKFNFI